MSDESGPVLIIGGNEDRSGGDTSILGELAEAVRGGPLLVISGATQYPVGLIRMYQEVFRGLGVPEVVGVHFDDRAQAQEAELAELARGAGGFFFTGGDQLRLTSLLGGTPLLAAIRARHAEGAPVSGTSAGAAALASTMIVSGPRDASQHISDAVMAPGLGLLDRVIVDTHFAERGRIGRLIATVARNPEGIGLGLDEDTAVLLSGDTLEVLGTGAVYVADARDSGWSNLSDCDGDGLLSIHDVRVHVLIAGGRMDRDSLRPRPGR